MDNPIPVANVDVAVIEGSTAEGLEAAVAQFLDGLGDGVTLHGIDLDASTSGRNASLALSVALSGEAPGDGQPQANLCSIFIRSGTPEQIRAQLQELYGGALTPVGNLIKTGIGAGSDGKSYWVFQAFDGVVPPP